jgi:tetratricopeptide (TPR) repeat protein
MGHLRRSFLVSSFLILAGLLSAQSPSQKDYSKEGFVIQHWVTKVTFENDGTSLRSVEVQARIQSEPGVQKFGLLTIPYQASMEILDFDYVRVHKADGSVVSTPAENIQDQSSEVSRTAPLYSDQREKHVAVKGLGIGDTMEYRCHWKVTTPLAPGQFWYEDNFEYNYAVLDQQVEIRIPKDRAIKLKSRQTPKLSEDGNYKVYSWKSTDFTTRPESDDNRNKAWEVVRGRFQQPDIRLSTFQSWEEVGHWYADLQRERVQPDPEIQAKAAELTKSATDDASKVRAIYQYVSTKFRYIGIDFGIGRYQPHKASEVLGNQYGDCKDKHTLLAALLAAVGIKAGPALISTVRVTDPDVPSPGQFDHVITVVSLANEEIWLDTTTEVAPFTHLASALRDKYALVISPDKAATLEMTPANPPFREFARFSLVGKLSEDGVLDAKVERSVRGDNEISLRARFRRLPQSQWPDLVQSISYSTGFPGSVSDVVVSSPEDTDRPFQISYNYSGKDYSGWKDKQIAPPLPLTKLFTFTDEGNQPVDPVWLGAPGEMVMEAKIELPKGYVAKTPEPIDIQRDFAEYHSRCEVKDGVMIAKRHFVVKQYEVPVTLYASYKSLARAITNDEERYTTFTAENGSQPDGPRIEQVVTSMQDEFWQLPNSRDPEAERLEEEGRMVWRQRNMVDALSMLQQSVAADPKFARAWVSIADLDFWNGRQSEALEAYRKAIAAEPTQPYPYKALGIALMGMRKFDDAIPIWQELLKNAPDDRDALMNLGTVYLANKRYSDAATTLETAVKQDSNNARLQANLGTAYLHTNNLEKAKSAYTKATELEPGRAMLNDAAYAMADAGANLDMALDYAQKAVRESEETSQKIQLSNLQVDDLRTPMELSAYWDTLGWVYFQRGELEQAEKTTRASWELAQIPMVANHLGEIYEKEQKNAEALNMYRMALAAVPSSLNPAENEILQHIKRLGGKAPARQMLGTYGGGGPASQARMTRLSRFTQKQVYGEFFVLFGPGPTVIDAKFISGSDELKNAVNVFKTARFDIPFPPGSQAHILRRGMLGCYPASGCSFVFLAADSVHSLN